MKATDKISNTVLTKSKFARNINQGIKGKGILGCIQLLGQNAV
jgi:hypothetical protein